MQQQIKGIMNLTLDINGDENIIGLKMEWHVFANMD